MRFLSGFMSATLLWGGLFFAYSRGHLDSWLPAEEPSELASAAEPVVNEPPSPGKKRVRRPKLRRAATAQANGRPSGASAAAGESTTGDDIGWDKQRNVDMNGAEGQLAGGQIDAGFDSVMGRIRRCLILVPSDGDVTGKLVFGMRVGSDGKPKAVNLSGPSIVTTGESGSCLRDAANSIRFATFNGPDMLFKYPITLQ